MSYEDIRPLRDARTVGDWVLEMARPEDAANLQRMLTTVFTDNFIGYTIYQSPQSATFLRTLIENPRSNYIRVWRHGDEITAFSQSSLQDHSAHLGFIGVAPEQQGNGFAKLLLEDLIGYVKQSERTMLTLDVFEDNEKPFRWYHKRGFKEQERYQLARIRLEPFLDGSPPISVHSGELSQALENENEQGFGNVSATLNGQPLELGLVGGRRLRLRSGELSLVELLPALASAFASSRESLIVSGKDFSFPDEVFESRDVTVRMKLTIDR